MKTVHAKLIESRRLKILKLFQRSWISQVENSVAQGRDEDMTPWVTSRGMEGTTKPSGAKIPAMDH